MDEYGCLTVSKQDAELVRQAMDRFASCTFPLNTSEGTALIFVINAHFYKIGVMPSGGDPTGRIFVSNVRSKTDHFLPRPTEWSYFEEKLGLTEEDAKGFARFWKMVWEPEVEDEG